MGDSLLPCDVDKRSLGGVLLAEGPRQLHSHVWGLGETDNPSTHLWPLLKAVRPSTQAQGSHRKGSRKSRSRL